jgi:uncharacterized damage-inducible protein DinB
MLPELQSYLELIEDLRSQVGNLITDLTAEALSWRPIEGSKDHATNSLAVLATHVAGAEHFWIAEVIGSRPATRQGETEFVTQETDPTELRRLLEKIDAETREVFSTLLPVDLDGTRQAHGRTVPVRWAILHVIEHTALHLGHMQLTYQLWMGGKSIQTPRWFQRLPEEK